MAWRRRGSKYGAIKTIVNGITFDSKREAHRYNTLLLMLKAGEITDLTLQPNFELQPGFIKMGKKYRPITYSADFTYKNKMGETITEDVKGMETQQFKLRLKMFHYKFQNLKLEIVK